MITETIILDARAQFATWLRFNGARAATVNTHLRRLDQFIQHTQITHLHQITPDLVARWLSDQTEQQTQYQQHPTRTAVARPLSSATINGRLLTLRYFLRTCVKQGLLSVDPLHRLPNSRRKTAKGNKMMSAETAVSLLITARQLAAIGEPLPIRDYALLAFMLDTGVRVGEATSVQLPGLAQQHKTAWVNGKTGRRLVEYSDDCATALAAWLNCHPGGDFLFVSLGNRAHGRPLTPNAVRIIFNKLAAAANVPGPVNPHSIRHLVGQRWVDHANPRLAQEKLGHSDIKTTLGFYYRPDRDKLSTETERLTLLSE